MFNEETHRRLVVQIYGTYEIDAILQISGRFLKTHFGFKTFEGNVFSHRGTVQTRLGYTDRELATLKSHQRTLSRSVEKIKRYRGELGTDYLLVADASTDVRATNKALVESLRELSYLLVPLLAPKRSHDLIKGNLLLNEDLGILSSDGRHYIHGYLHMARRVGQKPITEEEARLIVEVAREISQAVLFAKFRDLVHHLANTDALTGTWHFGRYFLPRLEEVFDKEPVVSVILIDVDHFKGYNDTFGHPFGSRLIVQCACFLQKNLRPDALLSRMGGDEFAILLLDTPAVARRIAERLRRKFEQHRFEREGEQGTQPLTISVGVADSTQQKSPETLLEHADQALYEAKRQGRNKVCSAPDAD